MEETVKQNFQTLTRLVDEVIEFAVVYGFQVLGALVGLFIGLKIAGWAGRKTTQFSVAKQVETTLAGFFGNIVKIIFICIVVIITLGNFGVTITPLVALAGAATFGITMALQGPVSNYGSGISIIVGRPFLIGDTISVVGSGVSGVVEEIKLAYTLLVGEDGEQIIVPNKEIIGRVIVNSKDRRVVQTKIALAGKANIEATISALKDALSKFPELQDDPRPVVGVHDFTYVGVVLGVRFWVSSQKYFRTRYAVNEALLKAVEGIGEKLLSVDSVALTPERLSADENTNTFSSDSSE
ncbi:MAG: mechanosensitive ion channel family protein [Nitrospina sp.]|nr:mechanosensitive ion channel family protein [Nitrospina sp.]